MNRDNIVRYTLTSRDGVQLFCTLCDRDRIVWAGLTEGGDVLTCCTTCHAILNRAPADIGSTLRRLKDGMR
jgi:cytochrome c2